jgi:hypothetical protein
MRHITLALIGALAFAAPAGAQIVNGTNSPDKPLPEAPLGTKAGGSSASMQAPGEGPAVAGAIQNNAEAQAGQQLPPGTVIQRQTARTDDPQTSDEDKTTDSTRRSDNGY